VYPGRARVLALLVAALVFAPAAEASERHPTQGELESEVVCPTCHTTLDQSSSPIAQRMKAFISVRIRAGDTKSEIEDKLVDQFGQAVLAKPATHGFDLLAWLLPLVGLLGGAALVAVAAWRWSRARAPDAAPAAGSPLDPDLERRVDEELARFE
jgi:cytochrome c-type biogenesis protein CcmH